MNTPEPLTTIELIHHLCQSIYGLIGTVDDDDARPYRQRERITKRLMRIFYAIVVLTGRMNPFKLGADLFAALRQPPARTPGATTRTRQPRKPGPPYPLSARRAAMRLANLIRQFDALVHEYKIVLDQELQYYLRETRSHGGCDALPASFHFTPATPRKPRTPVQPRPTAPEIPPTWNPPPEPHPRE